MTTGDPCVGGGASLSLEEIKQLTDMGTIQRLLKELNQHEQRVDHELDLLLACRSRLETSMTSLLKLHPTLQMLHTDGQQLGSTVTFTCELAEHVSSKVRQLDLAQTNVQQTIKKVEDIIDLQNTVDGLEEALDHKDYSAAAAHVHRYHSFDPALLQDRKDKNEQGEGKGNIASRLARAADQLAALVNTNMDAAIKKDNIDDINRYLKLFPLIGEDAAGLRKYNHYVCTHLGQRAQDHLKDALREAGSDSSKLPFVRLVTQLFEDVAKCVEVETGVIEGYYGQGRALSLLQALARETDRQAGSILDTFTNERKLHKLGNEINQARYSRPAQRDLLGVSGGKEDQGGPDPRDLDSVLWEMATISNRAELFDRFMRRRAESDYSLMFSFEKEDQLAVTGDVSSSGAPLDRMASLVVGQSSILKRNASATAEEAMRREKKAKEWHDLKEKYSKEIGRELLSNHVTGLNRRLQELMGHYVMMEEYFMQLCVNKAIRLDTREAGQHTSTMVDDVFFVVQKCTRRAMSSNSVDSVCAALNNTNRIVESDFGSVLKKNLYIGVTDTFTNLFSGTGDLKDVFGQMQRKMETTTEARFQEYMVHLNNVETSAKYINKLQSELTAEFETLFAHLPERTRQKGTSCLGDLSSTAASFQQTLEEALEKMCNYAIYPRIRSYCEGLGSLTYALTDEELAFYDVNDPFVHGLIAQLDALLSPFKEGLTESNFESMSKLVTQNLTATLESIITTMAFNQNGGLQLDKDIRMLVAFLTGLTQWTVRDKFARLTQIATILCLDSVSDMHEYWGGSSGVITWRLTPSEVRKTLALRTDFHRDEINRLKL
eukprot:comp23264_c0_seq1/m.38031 comp23264_c0_seq1/g.38031  ORF comp23264_c0_seq1/g.38031 comp23264_c0_seq1/m.38031 type:complete len:831 (-) comp23264_c0_seq1:734-3226(-)